MGPAPVQETQTVKCCACCSFIKDWLAGRKNRSVHDVAAALLIHFLYQTRKDAYVDGVCGLGFQAGDLEPLGIGFPEEAGLEILAKPGWS